MSLKSWWAKRMGETKPTAGRAMHAEAAVMIREAREHIEKDGWAKGAWKQGRAVCLMQGINDVNGVKHGQPVKDEVLRIITKHIDNSSIPGWNDAHDRKKEHVITILLAAEQMEKELAE